MDPIDGFDPALPPSIISLANVCFAFGIIAMVGALEERNMTSAIAGCFLFVAGIVAWHLQRQAKKRDQENAKRENNSNPTT
jgi:hypothetical protein